MTNGTRTPYRFGPYELDVASGRLLRDGDVVSVAPKAFDLLLLLVEHRGQLLEKEELMNRLWPDTVVEEANLSQQVFMLRKILGEQSNGRPYIDTVPRRGYLFDAPLERVGDGPTVASSSRRDQGRYWRLLALISLLVVLAAGVFYFRGKGEGSSATSTGKPKTLAVLPFVALDDTSTDEYLALGMADAVITRLAQIRGLVVRPTSSVLKYTSASVDHRRLGRELKVDALLDGRFQQVGSRIRVSVQLIDVGDGSSIWADRFDEPYTDVFAVQDAISERVAVALAASLTREERENLARRYTENLEAYHLYLRGRYFWERRTVESLQKSIEYYQQAIAQDPAYALAYAGLADSYNILGNFGALAPGEAYPKAKAAAATALSIDPHLSQAEIAKAFATYLHEFDWDEAERGFKRALAEAPNYGPGHQWYAVCLVSRGRPEEAVAEIQRAATVDPLSLVISAVTGWIHYLNRDYDQAIEAAQRTLEMDRNFPLAHTYLGMTYVAQSRYPEAEAHVRKALARQAVRDWDLSLLGFILARAGRTHEAHEILRDLQERTRTEYVSPYSEARVRLGLGQNDEALTLLERAVDEHYPWVIHLNVEPLFDPLRDDPRFRALLGRIGIPETTKRTE